MTRTYSLRQRLFALIMTPLLLVSIMLGIWRYNVAQATAEDLFDRSLLSAALAISRDVTISGGDLLSPTTSGLIHDAAGGEVFYHATGPDGIYVTGYAYPPAVASTAKAELQHPLYDRASYRNEPVRVLRIIERVSIDGISGNATVTVWQRMAEREEFAAQIARRAISLMAGLILTLALVVWFGVHLGLRPLLDLQQAISVRSPDDLSQIKRSVPVEVQGIVATLNHLLEKIQGSMNAHQVFISNAAHQLRNPAAAVLSMAETLRDSPTPEDRQERLDALITAARQSTRITNQLLSMDRLRQPVPDSQFTRFDINETVQEVCAQIGPELLSQGLEFELSAPDGAVPIKGDQVFISEALKNLIDNAIKHGGATLSMVSVTLRDEDKHIAITVSDDGKGLSPDNAEAALGRFSQVEPSDGSGLGLAIAATVAEQHGGSLTINPVETGASLTMRMAKGR